MEMKKMCFNAAYPESVCDSERCTRQKFQITQRYSS